MKEQEIVEGNKLIAEFMGLHFHKIGWVDQYHIDGNYECERLNYDWSWDWLMTVVNKIWKRAVSYPLEIDKICRLSIVLDIDTVYRRVVEFIKFYNNERAKDS